MLIGVIIFVVVVGVAVAILAVPGGLSMFGRSADLGPRADTSRRLWNEDEFRPPTDEEGGAQ